jgi:hypothetical protein
MRRAIVSVSFAAFMIIAGWPTLGLAQPASNQAPAQEDLAKQLANPISSCPGPDALSLHRGHARHGRCREAGGGVGLRHRLRGLQESAHGRFQNLQIAPPAQSSGQGFLGADRLRQQTRSQLQTSQSFPTVGSQTQPGKGWFVILRIYGPLEPWIEKTWRPGEIELVN